MHVSVDISLITKHILDHDTSLKAEICGYLLLSVVYYYQTRLNSYPAKK